MLTSNNGTTVTYEFTLRVPAQQLDFARCVAAGQSFRWEKRQDGSWVGVDGEAWFHVFLHGEGTEEQTLQVHSNHPESRLTGFLRLDWDDETIRSEVILAGPEIATYLQAFPGLRITASNAPAEVLFTFLCTANNHLARIGPMVRFLAAQGEVIGTVSGVEVHRFPPVSEIALLSPRLLREKGFGYRAETIIRAAQFTHEKGGEDWLESLREQDYSGATDALREIPYVGRKLADCIALFGLDHTDAVPIDTHLWHAIVRIYYPQWADSPLTDLKYRTASNFLRNRFGRWAGWVQQHLFVDGVENWRSLKKKSESNTLSTL